MGVKKIVAAAFTDETDSTLVQHVDLIEWIRVGQLNRLLKFFREQKIPHAIMAGQIAPKNLFDLHLDWKALLVLAKLKQRNAESIFAAIGDELAKVGVDLLPATTFLEEFLAPPGLIAGPKLTRREEAYQDMRFDVPVIGVETIRIAADAKLRAIAIEAGKTLLLEKDTIIDLANCSKLSIVAR